MTNNNKFRSIVLAALLITSVFAGSIAFAGTAAAANVADGDADARYDSQNAFYVGQEVAFGGYTANTETVNLYATDNTDANNPTVTVQQETADADGDVVFDLSGLDTGETYKVDDPSGSGYIAFTVVEQQFGVDFDDNSVSNGDSDSATTELDVSSSNRAGTYNVEVSADGLDEDELEDIFNGDTDGDANDVFVSAGTGDDADDGVVTLELGKNVDPTVDFDGISADEYEFNFTVVDTGAEASDTITVEKSSGTDASFEDSSVAVEQGDSGQIQVNLQNTDTAWIQVGVSEDDGYEAVAEVTDGNDDGVVNVSVNTYDTSADDYGLSVPDTSDTDDSIDVTSGSAVAGVLDTGSYDYYTAVQEGDLTSNPDDIGTLSVVDRNTGSAQSWTAPANADEIETGLSDEDVLAAVESGVITQDSTIASSDYAILQFTETSGIYGAIEGGSSDVSVTLTEVNPGQNQEAEEITIDLSSDSSAVQVVSSDETNNLFVIVKTNEVTYTNNAEEEVTGVEGEWNATLSVTGEDLTGEEDGEETASTEFEIVDREATLDTNDDDVVEVTAGENASITGETSIAPGSEVSVKIQSESGADNPFVNRQTANVSDDGTFEANFDTADLEVGTNFTATVSANPGLTEGEVEYDATIVEGGDNATETTTDNGTADTTTATDETPGTETTTSEGSPSTDETDTTPDGTDTTSESTSPGFGIAVALVALAGAALLAVRRDN